MARRISVAGRTELLEAVSTRYGGATRPKRSRILDEFAAVMGYHRQHAIRLLSGWDDREKGGPHTANAKVLGVQLEGLARRGDDLIRCGYEGVHRHADSVEV